MNALVLVTGAAGFAGRHLVEHLAASHDVVAWSRTAPPPAAARLAAWRQIDLLDRDAVRAAVGALKPAAVFHCAGFPHAGGAWSDALRPLEVNVRMTHILFDALRRAGGRCRLVIPGSATVYAPSLEPLTEDAAVAPTTPYGLSKLAQEALGVRALREDGLDVVLTRSFNHTGPRQTPDFAAPSFARQIALIERGDLAPVIRVGNLEARRDLSDVRDVVAAYAALMRAGTPGVVYNVASGVGRTIRSVLDGLLARARVPIEVAQDPARLRGFDIPVLVGNATRLRQATGWAPAVPFERTLDDLLDYWRNSATLGA